jgi:ribosomal protein S17
MKNRYKENKVKIGDIVKIVSSTKEGDRDLSGIIVDIKTDKAKVVWELTESVHTQGVVPIDRLIKHPHF